MCDDYVVAVPSLFIAPQKKPFLETAPGEIHQMKASFSNFNAGITISFSCIAQTTMARQSTGSTTATVLSLGIFFCFVWLCARVFLFFPCRRTEQEATPVSKARPRNVLPTCVCMCVRMRVRVWCVRECEDEGTGLPTPCCTAPWFPWSPFVHTSRRKLLGK